MIEVSGLKIYFFYGRKGSGKSLFMAYLSMALMDGYLASQKKYPGIKKRKLYTNIKFSPHIEKIYANRFNYWTNPEQLYDVKNCDIIWDEVGKDLPSTAWADTPKEVKQIFSHLRKRGNRMFVNTQVYEDVDLAVRRQVDASYQISKLIGSRDISASLPPPKKVWGVILVRQFDPLQIEFNRDPENREEINKSIFPKILFITRKLVDCYDTTHEIPAYQPNTLKELIFTCREGENCKKKSKDGTPHITVKHVLV